MSTDSFFYTINMLAPSLIKFLAGLRKNNNKGWFDLHRNEYESEKNNFRSFVQEMIDLIAKFDASIAVLQPKDCVFRINRDVRFSKDKRPYKNNFAAYFNKRGKKNGGAGYYLHIEPGKSFAAVGIWMPPAEELALIRQEIDYNFDEWKKIISSSTFKKTFGTDVQWGDSLSRPPKGYTADNPAIDFLKQKSFVATVSFTDKELVEKNFTQKVAGIFRTGQPLIEFINRSAD